MEDKVIRCRVCGVLIDSENVADPIECPDECADCLFGELPFSFE